MHFNSTCEHCKPGHRLKKYYKNPFSTFFGVMTARCGSVNRRVSEVKLYSSLSGLRDDWGMERMKSHLGSIGHDAFPDIF